MAILDNKPIHEGLMAHSGITTAPTRTCPQMGSQCPLRTSAEATQSRGYTLSGITMRLCVEKYALYSTKTHCIDDNTNSANSDKNRIFGETKKNLEKKSEKRLDFSGNGDIV